MWLGVPYTQGLGNESPAHLWQRGTGIVKGGAVEIMRVRNSEGSAGVEPRGSHVRSILLGQPATSRLLFVGQVKKT